jgi:hypothetical protein
LYFIVIMSGGGGAGLGFAMSSAQLQTIGNMAPQPGVGPGCKSVIQANSSSTSGSASVGPISASATTASASSDNTMACAPTFATDQVTTTKYDRTTTVDKDVLLINKNTLKSISESVNQMVVNSITSTKSTSSQNVSINQTIEIKIRDIGGDLLIDGTTAEQTIDLTNIANMSFSAFDEVRTDLANDVLQQFKSNINQESMATMQADLEQSVANQNDAAIKSQLESKIEQVKTTQIPSSDPTKYIPTNDQANVHINQVTSTDVKDATHLSAGYTNEVETEKTIETHVMNSVTQNFTKETLTQLSQIINSTQKISIDVEGVGGNVTIKNTKLTSNVILRQTLASQMNVGTAVTNSVFNTLGAQTDDSVTTKNTNSLGLTNKSDLRSGNTAKGDMDSKLDFKQTISQDFGMGSCGSSASSCICCIICIVCILSSGLGAVGGGGGEDYSSEEYVEENSSPQAAPTAPPAQAEPQIGTSVRGSSESDSVGGYYYFD